MSKVTNSAATARVLIGEALLILGRQGAIDDEAYTKLVDSRELLAQVIEADEELAS